MEDKKESEKENFGSKALYKVILVTGIFAFKLLTFYFSQVSKMRKIQMQIKNCLVELK